MFIVIYLLVFSLISQIFQSFYFRNGIESMQRTFFDTFLNIGSKGNTGSDSVVDNFYEETIDRVVNRTCFCRECLIPN